MTAEIIDWNVISFVEPILSGIEKNRLGKFEYNGNRIEFRGHRNNKTELSILLKSERKELNNTIDALLSYFLGRFELEGNRSYSYKLGRVTNLTTGEGQACDTIKVFQPINGKDEQYLTTIDNFVESRRNSKIVKAIEFFHYAKKATCPEHAFLSISNAFNYLIGDIGRQNRTRCSGAVAVIKLFYEQILKDEKSKKDWENNITWIHDTIDDIRYKNKQVSESDVERITKLFKEFLGMYIRYNNKRRNKVGFTPHSRSPKLLELRC